MRKSIHALWAAALLCAPLARTGHAADPPKPQAGTSAPVIGSTQIDRYKAISQLQAQLKQDPKSLADWVILGELAHEVALDLPADQAAKYNQMSLDAYTKALALSPDNPGLKAAVQFARDQEANQNQLERSREQATQTYLEARRRDLAAANYTPSVRVAAPPPVQPEPAAAAAANAPVAVAPPADPLEADAGMNPAAPMGYTYHPLYTQSTTSPYTFRQYSSAYYPPNYYGAGVAPMSAQRYLQQSLINAAGRQILRGAGGIR